MKKYVASSPDAELTGASLSSLSTNLLAETIRPILEQYGLTKIDPEQWYSQQIPLDILHETKNTSNEMFTLVAVGQQVINVIDAAQLPPVETFFEGVSLLSAIYDLNHRNKAVDDRIIVTEVNPNLIQVVNATPYPDDLIYGYVYSIVYRFASSDHRPNVQYADINLVNSDENMVINVQF